MSPVREVINPGAPLLEDDDTSKRGMSACCPNCSKMYPYFDSEDRPLEIPKACSRCNSPMVGAGDKAFRDFSNAQAAERQQPWAHQEEKKEPVEVE